jgi:hypothetical protein
VEKVWRIAASLLVTDRPSVELLTIHLRLRGLRVEPAHPPTRRAA